MKRKERAFKDKLSKDISIEDIHIEQADFKDFLRRQKAESVDLILTDPPYNISRETGFSSVKTGVKRFAVSMEFGSWDKEDIDLAALALGMHRVLRSGGTAIVWYDLWKLTPLADALKEAGFKMLRVIFWQKTNPVPLNMKRSYLSNSREMAIVAVKVGKPCFNASYDSGLYSYPIPRHGGRRLHSTQKPLALFSELIEKHSRAGDLVVDPFLGSGTTALAARDLQRRFAGCDIDKAYVSIAKKRF